MHEKYSIIECNVSLIYLKKTINLNPYLINRRFDRITKYYLMQLVNNLQVISLTCLTSFRGCKY